jgi:hypothetical protein
MFLYKIDKKTGKKYRITVPHWDVPMPIQSSMAPAGSGGDLSMGSHLGSVIRNGGFEIGSFTFWIPNVTGTATATVISSSISSSYEGNYSAIFNTPVGSVASITQSSVSNVSASIITYTGKSDLYLTGSQNLYYDYKAISGTGAITVAFGSTTISNITGITAGSWTAVTASLSSITPSTASIFTVLVTPTTNFVIQVDNIQIY